MVSDLNSKPFGLGFKSPQQQFSRHVVRLTHECWFWRVVILHIHSNILIFCILKLRNHDMFIGERGLLFIPACLKIRNCVCEVDNFYHLMSFFGNTIRLIVVAI